MKTTLIAMTLGLSLLGSTSFASAPSPVVCEIVANIAGNAQAMRERGYTQEDTAQAGGLYFSQWVNARETRKEFTNEERRNIGRGWARIATYIIQETYSDPVNAAERERRNSPDAAAVWAFERCITDSW